MRMLTLVAVLTAGCLGPSATPKVKSPGKAVVEGLPRPLTVEFRPIDADITARRVGRMEEIQGALQSSFSTGIFEPMAISDDFVPERMCQSQRASIVVVPTLRVLSFEDERCSSRTSIYDTLTDTSGDDPEPTSITCKNTHERIRAELSLRIFRSDRCSLVLGGITMVADSKPKKGGIEGSKQLEAAEDSAVAGILHKLSRGVLTKQLDKAFKE